MPTNRRECARHHDAGEGLAGVPVGACVTRASTRGHGSRTHASTSPRDGAGVAVLNDFRTSWSTARRGRRFQEGPGGHRQGRDCEGRGGGAFDRDRTRRTRRSVRRQA